MATQPRSALITGAASGIGAAIARRLASAGQHVTLVDLDAVGLEALAAELRAAGATVTVVATDLAAADAPAAALAGIESLDSLVLCAGIYRSTPVGGFDLAAYRTVVDVNLTAAIALAVAAVPVLRRSRAPRILSISSIQATNSEAGSLAYAISKAGLSSATRGLAVELAPDGILVNALAPGFIETPMAILPDGRSEHETESFRAIYVDARRIPLARPGDPDEVATVAEFFVSEANTYVTGQVITVDGGLTAGF